MQAGQGSDALSTLDSDMLDQISSGWWLTGAAPLSAGEGSLRAGGVGTILQQRLAKHSYTANPDGDLVPSVSN